MKILPVFLCLFLIGCADSTVMLDTAARPARQSVTVFKDGDKPSRSYQVIAEMSWHGPRQDELISQAHFMKAAAKMGADAILFQIADVDSSRSITAIGGPAGSVTSGNTKNEWFFKAKAIVYEP